MQRDYLKRLADRVLRTGGATPLATGRNMVRKVSLTVWWYRLAGLKRFELAILPTNDPWEVRDYLFDSTGFRVAEVRPYSPRVEE